MQLLPQDWSGTAHSQASQRMLRPLPNVSWIVEVMIRLFIVSLRLLVQQSPPPARHFGGRAAFLGLNWHHMQTPQLKRISDVNLSFTAQSPEISENN